MTTTDFHGILLKRRVKGKPKFEILTIFGEKYYKIFEVRKGPYEGTGTFLGMVTENIPLYYD